jgi:hypothetical protein
LSVEGSRGRRGTFFALSLSLEPPVVITFSIWTILVEEKFVFNLHRVSSFSLKRRRRSDAKFYLSVPHVALQASFYLLLRKCFYAKKSFDEKSE